MKERTATLAYDPNAKPPHEKFRIVEGPRVFVKPGDVIIFKLDEGTLTEIPEGRLDITFTDAEVCAPATLTHGTGEGTMTLTATVASKDKSKRIGEVFKDGSTETAITTFECRLLDANGLELVKSKTGGEIVPDRG